MMYQPVWTGRPRVSIKSFNKKTTPTQEPKPRIIPRWAAKGLAPARRINGKLILSTRRGKHACNKGAVVVRSPHIRYGC